MSLWVCSKWNGNPTDEEKWEVFDSDGPFYQTVKRVEEYVGWMPKSDYRPCDPPKPPERWTDVTGECEAYTWTWDGKKDNTAYYLSHEGAMVQQNAGYRLRKVQLYTSVDGQEVADQRWAFIVEKREK